MFWIGTWSSNYDETGEGSVLSLVLYSQVQMEVVRKLIYSPAGPRWHFPLY